MLTPLQVVMVSAAICSAFCFFTVIICTALIGHTRSVCAKLRADFLADVEAAKVELGHLALTVTADGLNKAADRIQTLRETLKSLHPEMTRSGKPN